MTVVNLMHQRMQLTKKNEQQQRVCDAPGHLFYYVLSVRTLAFVGRIEENSVWVSLDLGKSFSFIFILQRPVLNFFIL